MCIYACIGTHARMPSFLLLRRRAALDAHFSAVAGDLLKEMGGRLWRNRQAAAAAFADLLQGRR